MIKNILSIFLKILGWFFLMILTIITTASIVVFVKIRPIIKANFEEARSVIENSTYEDFLTNETTYIFDDNNKILKKLTFEQDSQYLEYKDIPRDVVNAFVAVEDRNFWNHDGIDLRGIVRVLYRYVNSNGDEKHGASTITQQITRRAFLNFDVTMERKIKEIFYSLELEKKYTKEEIMEFYVNDIYYANQCYGISSASKFYFNKNPKDLTLSQTAYLCAIPNSPTYYDPVKNYENALTRRDKILNDMYECGYITDKEYNDALDEEIILDLSGNDIEFSNYQTTYAIKCATEYLMKLDGFEFRSEYEDETDFKKYLEEYNTQYEKAYKKLSSGGYKVYTSLNSEKQNILQESIDSALSFDNEVSEDNIYTLQGAATLINNETGKVEAIVGGRSQTEEDNEESVYSLNRAFQSYRQPGSSIKPLVVYTPGLESGFMPNSIIYSISVSEANKKGTDIEKLTGTPFTYRRAVEKSNNGAAYYVYFRVGPRKGIKYLQNMNFKKIVPDDYFMSSGLGGLTYGVTTEEMASAYSCLSNSGKFKQPTCITSIINNKGEEIYEDTEEKQIYKESSANAMADILKGVITNGTAAGSVKWNYNIDIGGKTGTTNENKDGWFSGFSPYYTLSVWVGKDDPQSVKGLQGGSYPAKIWSNVMNKIHEGLEEKHFGTYEIKDLLGDTVLYNSYLPGKKDDEILSGSYTVADYRIDHVIGAQAENYIDMLLSVNPITSSEQITTGQSYYNSALNIINTIRSSSYRDELINKLNAANTQFANAATIYNTQVLLLQQQQQQQQQQLQGQP